MSKRRKFTAEWICENDAYMWDNSCPTIFGVSAALYAIADDSSTFIQLLPSILRMMTAGGRVELGVIFNRLANETIAPAPEHPTFCMRDRRRDQYCDRTAQIASPMAGAHAWRVGISISSSDLAGGIFTSRADHVSQGPAQRQSALPNRATPGLQNGVSSNIKPSPQARTHIWTQFEFSFSLRGCFFFRTAEIPVPLDVSKTIPIVLSAVESGHRATRCCSTVHTPGLFRARLVEQMIPGIGSVD
jgi:hypothetical protein